MSRFQTAAALGVLAVMLSCPAQAMAAIRGAAASWWQNVLPALLPFFILTEFLSRTGLLPALSVWLGPVMRPLFRLPGSAALGLCMGFFAGSPTGGAVAGRLRGQGLISRGEGERLCAFCNNAGPMYILLAVTASLGNPGEAGLGIALMLAHYPLNLLWGLLLRFCAPPCASPGRSPKELLSEGWRQLRQTPPQPLALLLRQSSLAALTNIALVGAFMLIFSLALLALRQSGLLAILGLLLTPLCRLFDISAEVVPALAEGCFEMTLGVNALAACSAPLPDKLLAASMILGWSGLSIHCQIAGVLAGSDLTLKYYLPCRLLHTLAAPALLLLLFRRGWPVPLEAMARGAAALPAWLYAPGLWLACSLCALLGLLAISFALAFINSAAKP